MQISSFKIWSLAVDSASYDDNCNAMSASIICIIRISFFLKSLLFIFFTELCFINIKNGFDFW